MEAVPKPKKETKSEPDPLTIARGIVKRFRDLPEPERTYVAVKLREIAPDLFHVGPKN